jgi:catechol 2,3-dioxygenase-like lactoylglutathione lyase family enzyme
MIESISAVTLATHDMRRAVEFYRALGFRMKYSGKDATFTSFYAGTSYLNLIAEPEKRKWAWWGSMEG